MICPRLPSWFVLITRHSTSEGWKGTSSSAISSRILAMLKPNCGAGAGTAAEELCRGESAGRTLAGCFLGAVTEVSLIKSGDGQFSSREKGLLSRAHPVIYFTSLPQVFKSGVRAKKAVVAGKCL